jgi:hypothetical protein
MHTGTLTDSTRDSNPSRPSRESNVSQHDTERTSAAYRAPCPIPEEESNPTPRIEMAPLEGRIDNDASDVVRALGLASVPPPGPDGGSGGAQGAGAAADEASMSLTSPAQSPPEGTGLGPSFAKYMMALVRDEASAADNSVSRSCTSASEQQLLSSNLDFVAAVRSPSASESVNP